MPNPLASLINSTVVEQSTEIAERFARREPFRHVVIENFFSTEYANRLLAEFPSFERGNARNEAGELGNKSTVERVRELSPTYRQLDELIQIV